MLLKSFRLPQEHADTKKILLYLFVAYLFAVGVRALLYFQAADIAAFWLDGRPLPIWSPDAGLYGYYAKQILSGHHYPFVAEYMPGHLIAAATAISGLSIDKVMFWLPAILASLIVVPVILSAHAYKLTTVGFVAALIAGAGANYYTRSYLGYMDTDTLNVVLPWTAVMFWIFALTRRKLVYALPGALTLLAFRFWYHSAAAILLGMVAGLLLCIVLFFRKEKIGYEALLLAAIAIAPLHFGPAVLIITAATVLFYLLDTRTGLGVKPYLVLLLTGTVAAAFVLDIHSYVQRAEAYFDKPEQLTVAAAHGTYRFSNVLSTVIEAKGAPVWQINPLFGGMLFYILPALVGYLLLCLAYPAFFSGGVLLLLGLSSVVAGIRFGMFATPAFALGFVYLLFWSAYRFIGHGLLRKTLPPLFAVAAIGLMLTNILRLNPHLQPFYFKHNEVKALEDLAKRSSSNDLILSWWDYGWPLWYYTGRNNTLIDNGRHGSDTFYVGNMLLSSNPVFVANSAEYADRVKTGGHPEVTPYLARHEDIFDAFRRFSKPDTNITSPGTAYLLLHRDMLPVLPTIAAVADRDPRTGKPTRQRQFYLSDLRRPYTPERPILEGDTFTLDLRSGVITGSDGASARIGGAVVSENGKLVAAQRYDRHASMYMIIYNKTKALYMDGSVFNSFVIQALLLDRYDKKRFEKVADTGIMKIFKAR